jgi:hypothetical protein
MGGLIYKIFPGLKDFEEKAEQAITIYNGFFETTKSLGDYVVNNGDVIIEKFEKGIGGLLKEIKDDFTKNVKISPTILKPFNMPYAPSSHKGNGKQAGKATNKTAIPTPAGSYANKEEPQRQASQAPIAPQTPTYDGSAKEKADNEQQERTYDAGTQQPSQKSDVVSGAAQPIDIPTKILGADKMVSGWDKKENTADRKQETVVDKKTSLDEIVKEFKNKLRQFNTGYDANIDVYDKGSIIRSYSPFVMKQQPPHQTRVESLRLNADQKYLEDSIRIAEMYNQGYKTRWIVKEAAKKGYASVNNYNDITDRVALSISSGMNYTNSKYNNSIATKLGLREQLVNDYLSGKSYKEIKENLKARTNGMSISDSSILRTMHKYEKEAGKKVVGKRNGNGRGKGKKK